VTAPNYVPDAHAPLALVSPAQVCAQPIVYPSISIHCYFSQIPTIRDSFSHRLSSVPVTNCFFCLTCFRWVTAYRTYHPPCVNCERSECTLPRRKQWSADYQPRQTQVSGLLESSPLAHASRCVCWACPTSRSSTAVTARSQTTTEHRSILSHLAFVPLLIVTSNNNREACDTVVLLRVKLCRMVHSSVQLSRSVHGLGPRF
jgi:hypothetical protein